MTYKEFRDLALNPPRRDVDTIFIVIMLTIDGLPKRQHDYYPQFDVSTTDVCQVLTIKEAEANIRNAVKIARKQHCDDKIYCFHVKEYPLDKDSRDNDQEWDYHYYGLSWRLYDSTGRLIDRTWCSALERDFDTEYGKFRGRPENSIRFKTGDIVEVYDECNKCVRLAVATQSPMTIDWCWEYRKRSKKIHLMTDETEDGQELGWYYGLDFSDDQVAVIDGPGYEYHEHIPTLNIMPLRFPLSDRLRCRYDGYWKACQEQDKESK